MNEKSFIICFIVYLVAFIIVLITILHYRRSIDRIGKSLKDAERKNRESEFRIDNATDISERLAESVGKSKEELTGLSESVGKSGNIFEQIRKQKIN